MSDIFATTRIVAFLDGEAYYLIVNEQTESRIRGWVINGEWNIVIDLVSRSVSLDISQEGDGSTLQPLSTYTLLRIVSVMTGGHYNEVIEWARKQ